MDVATNEIVCQGLSMPHSPRWYRDQLWVLNSGHGEFGRVNLSTGQCEAIACCLSLAVTVTVTSEATIIFGVRAVGLEKQPLDHP